MFSFLTTLITLRSKPFPLIIEIVGKFKEVNWDSKQFVYIELQLHIISFFQYSMDTETSDKGGGKKYEI